MPRGRLRPPLLSVGRADEAHPHPHGSEAVPVPDLHEIVQQIGPPNDPREDAHRGEAVRVRRVRPQVRALRREEAARESAPEAKAEARARRRRPRPPRTAPARAALAAGARAFARALARAGARAHALARTFQRRRARDPRDARVRGQLNFTTFHVEVIK